MLHTGGQGLPTIPVSIKLQKRAGQANMQAAYLFNYSGKPRMTQKYTRAIMDQFYGITPYHGWEGDEDEGQMGAWYVMSAMGFFEMNGGTSPDLRVDLTGPLFDRIRIQLDPHYYPGHEFVIETRNQSKENMYIRSVSLNGKELKGPWFRGPIRHPETFLISGSLKTILATMHGKK